jgi:hypothetical protein
VTHAHHADQDLEPVTYVRSKTAGQLVRLRSLFHEDGHLAVARGNEDCGTASIVPEASTIADDGSTVTRK